MLLITLSPSQTRAAGLIPTSRNIVELGWPSPLPEAGDDSCH
jgi:hypothetical protein